MCVLCLQILTNNKKMVFDLKCLGDMTVVQCQQRAPERAVFIRNLEYVVLKCVKNILLF